MNFPQYRCTLFEPLWIRNSMDPNVDDFRSVFEEISHSRNNKQWRTDRGLPLTPLAPHRIRRGAPRVDAARVFSLFSL